MVWVEQHLLLQQDASDPEQPFGNPAQGAARGMTTRPDRLVAAAAFGVVLHGDPRPMEHRLAQPGLSGMTTMQVLPLRLVTGATPVRVLRAA